MIRVPSGETMAFRSVVSVSQPSCGPVNLVPYSTHPIWPGPDCRAAHHSFETPAILGTDGCIWTHRYSQSGTDGRSNTAAQWRCSLRLAPVRRAEHVVRGCRENRGVQWQRLGRSQLRWRVPVHGAARSQALRSNIRTGLASWRSPIHAPVAVMGWPISLGWRPTDGSTTGGSSSRWLGSQMP